MRVIPRNQQPRVQFYLTHLTKWIENAEALGLSEVTLTDLQARVEAAKAALRAQSEAQQRAHSATLNAKIAIEAMSDLGSCVMQQIRANAATLGPQTFTLASIPPPNDSSPVAAPGKPYQLKAELMNGWLSLGWKCHNPRDSRGTIYYLYRSLDGGPMAFLGLTGDKTFADRKIPKGACELTYQIQAMRSTKLGPVARFPVRLNGANSPAEMQVASEFSRRVMVAA